MRMATIMLVVATGATVVCSAPGTESSAGAALPSSPAPPPLDTALIESIVGLKGVERDGQYKISVPQNDLAVSVDGFRIIPPMGLTLWVAFAPAPEGAIVMGDLILLEDEIGPVGRTVIASGLTLSALHNHFVRDTPKVMFPHIHGVGPLPELAQGVRATLDRIEELRRQKGWKGRAAGSVETTFDPKVIDEIIGRSGNLTAGVYKITVGRPDVKATDHGAEVSSFMGFNTWMAFQGSSEKAAVAGDFAMLEHEVAPVIEALVERNIEVVAIHNHWTTADPRVFFLHFWGVGRIEDLARGLKAGLNQTGSSDNPANARLSFDGAAAGSGGHSAADE